MEPLQGTRRSPLARVNLWGVLFVVMGVWWLLGEMAIVPFSWSYVGALAIITVGLGMIFRR